MKTKDSTRRLLAEYLQATCPHGSETVTVGVVGIIAQPDSWKIYWDELHYMVFSEAASDREVNAIHCLLMQHMASVIPAPDPETDWAAELAAISHLREKAIEYLKRAIPVGDTVPLGKISMEQVHHSAAMGLQFTVKPPRGLYKILYANDFGDMQIIAVADSVQKALAGRANP